ncbi:MAG: CHASE2 domain-containing protein [Candidatus Omnitrophota bacterium]
MEKVPAGLVQKRQGYITEPLRRMVLFFTPLRTIQILGFVLVFVLSLSFSGTAVFRSLDNHFYDQFLKYQPAPKVDPAVVYIGIDKNSLQSIRPFPWPKRYYAAITRILREWGAKAVVFNLFFAQDASTPEDDQALLEEFKKTPNFYLPISFESEGFKNYYYINQSAQPYSAAARGIGHINYSQDPDNVVRRVYPFVKFNKELVPHLGIRVAYDFLGKPVPTMEKCDFPRDDQNNLLIHWAKRWNASSGYYPFVDVLNSYALASKGKTAPISAKDFQGKICLVGMTASDYKITPLESASPGIGALGNIINTILTGQYIRVVAPRVFAGLLLGIALLAGLVLIPFRAVFSTLAVLVIAGLWILASFTLFAWAGIWTGVAAPLFLLAAYFLISFVVVKIQEHKERLYFLSLAVRDELTGLFVMRYVNTFLSQALNYSRTFRKPFAVVLLDIDDFRKINEAYGHRTGDEVLKKVAEIIQVSIRTKGRAMPDIAGRYGEEEFIILLSGYNLATATFGVAERIRKAIERFDFRTTGGQAFKVTASSGVSALSLDEKNPQKVVERAQEGLLKAKAAGKNQTCIQND